MLIVSVNGTSCSGMSKSDLRPLMGTNDVHMVLRKPGDANGKSAEAASAAAVGMGAVDAEPSVCKYNGGPGKTCAKKASAGSEFCSGHTCPTCDESKSSRSAACAACAVDGGAAGMAKEQAKQEAAKAAQQEGAASRAREEEAAAAAAAAAAALAERNEAAALERDGPIVVVLDKRPGLKLGLKVGNKGGVNAVKKVIEGGLAATTIMKPGAYSLRTLFRMCSCCAFCPRPRAHTWTNTLILSRTPPHPVVGMIIVAVNGTRCDGLSKEECVTLLGGTGMMEIRLRKMSDVELTAFGGRSRSDSQSSIDKSALVTAATTAATTSTIIGPGPAPEWLHGQLGREESEALLLKHGTADGTFLVRERQADGDKKAYGLAVTFRGKVQPCLHCTAKAAHNHGH